MSAVSLAFCPQPDYYLNSGLNDSERAALEEWFALPEDLDADIQADQCDSCGANDYYAKTEDDLVWVVCKECGQEFRTARLSEHLLVF